MRTRSSRSAAEASLIGPVLPEEEDDLVRATERRLISAKEYFISGIATAEACIKIPSLNVELRGEKVKIKGEKLADQ